MESPPDDARPSALPRQGTEGPNEVLGGGSFSRLDTAFRA